MLPADDARTLSQLYHLNSEPWIGPEMWYSVDDHLADRQDARAVALPPPPHTTVTDLIQRRTSDREFVDRPLAARDLGSLLWCGYGVARTANVPHLVLHRTVPSAGALYPLELLAQTRAVESIVDGLYRYDAIGHDLRPTGAPNVMADLCAEPLLSQTFASRANAIVFITAVFDRTQRKYGPRGYRYVLLEAGHVAQNICLRATELGLGSICLGGFRDAKLNALLELDTRRVGVVYGVAVGQRP